METNLKRLVRCGSCAYYKNDYKGGLATGHGICRFDPEYVDKVAHTFCSHGIPLDTVEIVDYTDKQKATVKEKMEKRKNEAHTRNRGGM